MKKLTAILLAIALLVSLAACGGTGNDTHDYILSLLEAGEYDMAIYVIEGLRDGVSSSAPDGQAADTPGEEVFELTPEFNGSDWFFHMDLINYTGRTLTLEALIITDWMDETQTNLFEFRGTDLDQLPMGRLVLEPDTGRSWDDGHPAVDFFNRREYCHIFRDPQGQTHTIRYLFDMRGMLPENGPGVPQEEPEGSWSFPATLENTGDSPLTLLAMDITDLIDGQPGGTYIFEGADLERIGLGGLVLEPGQHMTWMDGHPYTDQFNGREYRFHFEDGNGAVQIQTFRFEDLTIPEAVDYSQDSGKDLQTLRHDTMFEVEVHPGVYWVNASSLGASRYSNSQIYDMLPASPEEKQASISTLYEALQLYQIGNFTPSDDNVRIFEGGVNWEHHKPGYYAVLTNTGCCATDSNWLHYLLEGDYEEVGFLATSQPDGSGHVYNYILQDGWYYFVDLTHYHATGSNTAVEDGDRNSYFATDFILGNIHRTRDVASYVDYVQQTFYEPPAIMFLYTAENVLAVDGARDSSGVQILYEDAGGLPIQVIYDDPADHVTFQRMPSPATLPDWKNLP